jgi:hypothetical protein
VVLVGNKQIGTTPQYAIWVVIKPYVVTWISMKSQIGTPHYCMSQTHFINSHTTSNIHPNYQRIFASQWHFLPSLVCAQGLLVVAVLMKVLSPCVTEIIQAQNEFSVQEHWLPNTSGPQQWGRGMHGPWGNGFPSTSPWWNYPRQGSRLLEIRHLKTTRITPEDTETKNCFSKAKFTSAEGFSGTWVQQTQGADHKPAF